MSKPMSGPGRAAAVRRLREGTAFHRTIQTAFVAGLVGATADPESPIPLSKTSSGRIDLLVAPVGDERMAVVVEVKNTDWDALLDRRVRPNFRSHVRQLQRYLDTIVGRIGEPDGWDSAMGVLLYRAAPTTTDRQRIINDGAEAEGLQVVYASATDWAHLGPAADQR